MGGQPKRAQPAHTSSQPDWEYNTVGREIKYSFPFINLHACFVCLPPPPQPSAGSSGDIRAGGSGRQWHLWTSLQGWCWWCCCEPSSVRARVRVCVCVCASRGRRWGGRNVEEHGTCIIIIILFFSTASLPHLDRYLFLHKASPPPLGTGAVWPGLSLPDNDLASRCSTDTRTHPLVPPLDATNIIPLAPILVQEVPPFLFSLLLLFLLSSVHTQSYMSFAQGKKK